MKNFLILISILLMLIGCSSEGNVKIINRTDHNVYFTLNDNDYTLEGSPDSNTEMVVSVDTGRSLPFTGNEKNFDFHLEGETFMMQAGNSGTPTGEYYTETEINVIADETLKIFCDPTHAGVKLINNQEVSITEFSYYTDADETPKSLITEAVFPEEMIWKRLNASSAQDSIIYSFIIEYENGTIDSSFQNFAWLEIDRQLLIE